VARTGKRKAPSARTGGAEAILGKEKAGLRRPACRSTPWPLPAITQLRGVRWDGSSKLLCTPTVARWQLRPSVIILLIGLAILVEAEESDGCIEPAKPQKKPYRPQIGGGDGGGKAVGRREDYQRWMPRTQCRTRRETEAANPWIGSMGRQSPEPRSRSTYGGGPVRESRTLGSTREAGVTWSRTAAE